MWCIRARDTSSAARSTNWTFCGARWHGLTSTWPKNRPPQQLLRDPALICVLFSIRFELPAAFIAANEQAVLATVRITCAQELFGLLVRLTSNAGPESRLKTTAVDGLPFLQVMRRVVVVHFPRIAQADPPFFTRGIKAFCSGKANGLADLLCLALVFREGNHHR